jgi:type IV pilus assembly protein PilM
MNVGLDLGTSAVRAAAVQIGKGQPALRAYGQVPLPAGAMNSGEIVDSQAVAAAITRLWKQVKLPRRDVVVGIANQRAIVRRVDLPFMPEQELRDALPFQAQEYIPIPIAEAILDFVPLEEYSGPGGEPMISALVVAAQRDMIAEVVNVTDQAGLAVKAIDLQAFAVVRAVFSYSINLDSGAQALVILGGGLTQVAAVRSGSVRFLRIIPVGGDQFTKVLADRVNLDTQIAEELKRRVGVALEGKPQRSGRIEEDATAVLTEEADALIEDIRGSLDFFASQPDGAPVERLLLAGNAARLPNLANRLSRMLNLPIEPVRVLGQGRVDTSKLKLSDQELMLAQPVVSIPVGLALWDEV